MRCHVYVCLWLPYSVPVNVLEAGLRMVRVCLGPAFGGGGPSYFNRCYCRVDRPLALGLSFPCANRSGLIVYT